MDVDFGVILGIWIFAFFANLIISFFVANAAARKGRSWAAFFWLSLLFSWILMAIIVAVLAPSVDAVKAATRNCPQCAEPVSTQAKLCKHCHSELQPLPESEQPVSAAAPGQSSKALVPIAFVFMGLGLAWIVIFYGSAARYPLGSETPIDLGNWNILLGFGFSMVGFALSVASKGKK